MVKKVTMAKRAPKGSDKRLKEELKKECHDLLHHRQRHSPAERARQHTRVMSPCVPSLLSPFYVFSPRMNAAKEESIEES